MRCPADCPKYQRRLADVNWTYSSLVTPPTPEEPPGLGSDDGAIAALLDAAEDIINSAGPEILAEERARQAKQKPPRNWRPKFKKKR